MMGLLESVQDRVVRALSFLRTVDGRAVLSEQDQALLNAARHLLHTAVAALRELEKETLDA